MLSYTIERGKYKKQKYERILRRSIIVSFTSFSFFRCRTTLVHSNDCLPFGVYNFYSDTSAICFIFEHTNIPLLGNNRLVNETILLSIILLILVVNKILYQIPESTFETPSAIVLQLYTCRLFTY